MLKTYFKVNPFNESGSGWPSYLPGALHVPKASDFLSNDGFQLKGKWRIMVAPIGCRTRNDLFMD